MTDGQHTTSSHTGLVPPIAALLCYLCAPVTGIVFLLLEKDDKLVRFHAWQAVAFSVTAFLVMIALSLFAAIVGMISTLLGGLIYLMMYPAVILFFVFWILCLIRAYEGERYHLPVLGDIVEAQLRK